jgi:hypothetical protein
MKTLSRRMITPALVGAALGGTACSWDAFYAQTSPPLQAVLAFQAASGESALRLVVEDFNQDGQMDVAALVGHAEGYGFGTYDVQQMGTSEALVVLMGDGKGGVKSQSRQPMHLGAPLDLKVWKATEGSAPVLALYGLQNNGEAYSGGTPELALFGVEQDQLLARASHVLAALPYGARVDVQAIRGDTPNTRKLLVAQPSAATGQTAGAPVSASVLASPEGEGFSEAGVVANNPHGTYDVFTVVDLNDDGRMDTVLTDSCVYTVSLQFAQPDGTVEAGPATSLSVQEIPVAVFVHKVNGEATPHVLLVSQSAVSLYRMEGKKLVQEEVTRLMGSATAAVQTDLDADGIEDLLITSSEGRVALLTLDRDGRVSARRIKDVEQVDSVDQNNDASPQGIIKGTLERLAPTQPALPVNGSLAPAAGDLNGDGQPDLVFGDSSGRVLVHITR